VSNGFQEPAAVPGQAASQWEQDVSIGGEDIHGEPAPRALAVAPQGIQTTRVVPTIAAASNTVTIAVGGCTRILGKTPQRRRVTVVAFPTAGAGTYGAKLGNCNVDENMARSNGLGLPQGVPVPMTSSSEVWVANTSAAIMDVSYWAEIDNG
jgi:hypothetical protein